MYVTDVLVLLPIHDEPLKTKLSGPYTIDKKVSDVDYIVCTPDRRKTMRMCHVNMLKGYHVRDNTKPVLNQNIFTSDTCGDDFVMNCYGCDIRLENADILSNLESEVSHLQPSQQCMYPDSNHVFDGGGCNVDNPCVECTIDIVKPIQCTICDAEFQVRLKQCNIVPANPFHCTVCGVEFQLNQLYKLNVLNVKKNLYLTISSQA